MEQGRGRGGGGWGGGGRGGGGGRHYGKRPAARGGGGGRGGRGPFRRARFDNHGRGRGVGGGGRYFNNNNRNNNNGRGGGFNGGNDVLEEIGHADVSNGNSLCIAIEGCCHGQLDAIYDRLQRYQVEKNRKIDLLLCCGDFQSLRNLADFHSLAVPPKYRDMGSFYKYYADQVRAPILTIFIGGNHEASQPLSELYYGGWVAPNIYYLGAAGVVNFQGVRIGGISGIYKSHDYPLGRFERPPYSPSTMRSIYHVRSLDVHRMLRLSSSVSSSSANDDDTKDSNKDDHVTTSSKPRRRPRKRLDLMLSHDWPQGVEQHGDTQGLLRRKPFFRDEVNSNTLGSPPNSELLCKLQPKFWFSAHLHVKFHATVRHDDNNNNNAMLPQRSRVKPAPPAVAAGNEASSSPCTTADADAAVSSLSLIPSQVQHTSEKKPSNAATSIAKSEDDAGNEKPSSTAPRDVPPVQSSEDDKMNVEEEPSKLRQSTDNVDESNIDGGDPGTSEQPSTASVSTNNTDDHDKKQTNETSTTTQFLAPEESSTGCMAGAGDISDLTEQMTRFLSLDKCLPRRQYLSIVHVPTSEKYVANAQLEYDAEWLAILRKTHHLTVTSRQRVELPTNDNDLHVTDEEIAWIEERFPSLVIPQETFTQTVPPFGGGPLPHRLPPPLPAMGNPQTDELLRRLELPHVVTIPYTGTGHAIAVQGHNGDMEMTTSRDGTGMMQDEDDENEINIDDDEDEMVAGTAVEAAGKPKSADMTTQVDDDDDNDDDNEINIDDDDNDAGDKIIVAQTSSSAINDDKPDENEIQVDDD